MSNSVTVPDEIFELSGKLAKKLKVSRSKIFAMGVKKLAEEEKIDKEEIIAKINEVCEKVDTSLDPAIKQYQSRIFKKEKW
ncbi:MAG: hypothetical protein R2747_16640 [Pyrinomonadaceae bacterium]